MSIVFVAMHTSKHLSFSRFEILHIIFKYINKNGIFERTFVLFPIPINALLKKIVVTAFFSFFFKKKEPYNFYISILNFLNALKLASCHL